VNSAQFSEPVERIRTFLNTHLSRKQAIIGVSGGVDSALVLKLLSISIERERITALFLPDGKPAEKEVDDVRDLSISTGVPIDIIDIHEILSAFSSTLKMSDTRVIGNVKSRIRMITLYYYANVNNGLVVGTTNRSEYYTGYFTKFGDGGCDIEPILHLSKTEVWDMARSLGVPDSIVTKPPSAGLWDGQTDESELGLKYPEIDKALDRLINFRGSPSNDVEKRVNELIQSSEHKRRKPESLL